IMTGNKFKIVGLGNPAAAVTAASLLKDKEFRQDAGAAVNKAFKVLGITAGAITAFVVTKKIVKNIKRNAELRKMKSEINDKKLTYSESWYIQQADSLKKAMPSGSSLWAKVTENYQEETIISTLENLKTIDDWRMLCIKYDKDEYNRNLTTALKEDDETDVQKYKDILARIGATL
ncbi:MAG: hypothetical protein K5685_06545, partial [Bacteroidales bacterium]|nr:hypothetical protein [Bacteroidales bacterium]